MAHIVELTSEIRQRVLLLVLLYLLKSLIEFLIKSYPRILGHCERAVQGLRKAYLVEILVWECKVFFIVLCFGQLVRGHAKLRKVTLGTFVF